MVGISRLQLFVFCATGAAALAIVMGVSWCGFWTRHSESNMQSRDREPQNTKREAPALNRRQVLVFGTSAAAALAAGCQNGFKIFGYQAGADALYDPNIRTVWVPTFNNRAFQTTPYRGFEKDVTLAVVREIGKTTTFRVTSDVNKADTELLGNIASISKNLLNRNQQNQVREAEITVNVDVVWRDLRDGTILSNARRAPRPGMPNPLDAPPVPVDPTVELPPNVKEREIPTPVRIVATGRMLPELGETNASAMTMIQTQIAVQIVSMMERKW